MSDLATMPEIEGDLTARLREAVEARDAQRLQDLVDDLSLAGAVRELTLLGLEERSGILALLPVDLASAIIEEAPTDLGSDMLAALEVARAVELLLALDSDVRADLIGNMDEQVAHAILARMDLRSAADVRRLAQHDADTAGGLMMSEVFRFQETQSVGVVLTGMVNDETQADRYRGQHPYILDARGRLVGVVSLRALLTAKRSAPLSSIMVEPLSVGVAANLSELEDIFDKHPFLSVPVVDADGKLVGAVSRSAVSQALLDSAASKALKLQGVVGDELRSMPLWLRSRRRLAWLSANIFLNIIAASVISAYEETLLAVIAIAIFLPMVSDMSGCSGNQAVGVTLRELTLGLVRPRDMLRVWLKEISVGVINGIALGILIGLVAWVWKGSPALGFVIGLALALNTMLAVSIGGVVPLVLKRFGQDPAAASGPLLTTVTDMAGFFFVLSLATLMMPLLVPR